MPNIVTLEWVFWPSHGANIILQCMAKNADMFKGKSVLDVGSGTWILAIFALKFWAERVCATDIDKAATRNTLKNARKNKVIIEAKTWNYWEPFVGEKFDVIIANLPQEKTSWVKDVKWNKYILDFLPKAEEMLNDWWRLIVPINGCTHYKETIWEIRKKWNVEKSQWTWIEIKNDVRDNISMYLDEKNVTLRERESWHETPIFYLILTKKTTQ